MRLLHTADWHMNSVLGRQNLSGDIVHSLARIADYLDEYAVDVMVVAGDLFSERSRDEGMARGIAELRELFGSFVARGGSILAVAGNHDSELRFGTLREALMLSGGNAPGAFVLTAHAISIALERGGEVVQFALLPYPTARAYLPNQTTFDSLEERNRLVQSGFCARLEQLRDAMNPALPAVLVSHVHVRGADSHALFKITEANDVVFEPSQIPARWDYAAYGHIHKPGILAGASHVRYSGSVTALDAAERFDQKSCVLVEIGPDGRRAAPQLLPLPGAKLHQIEIDVTHESPESVLAHWKAQIGADDLVFYTLKFNPTQHNQSALTSEIERNLGRVYGRNIEKVGVQTPDGAVLLPRLDKRANPLSGDVPTFVREFLSRQLEAHSDKSVLLSMAEELMADTGSRV